MKKSESKRPFDTLDFIEKSVPCNAAEIFRYGDLYSLKDHVLVRQAMQSALTEDEQEILTFYFWNDWPFDEISKVMGMTSTKVSLILETALTKIRKFCMRQPEFSRYPSYRLPRAA